MPRIALYDHKADNVPQSFDYTWPELASMLTTHLRRLEKDGPLWSPVRIEGTRANKNVQALTVLVFDLDAATEDQIVSVVEQLQREGLAFVVHSTHSHSPEQPKVRIAIQLSDEVSADKWWDFWHAARDHFHLSGLVDEQRKDLSGIYYVPAAVEGAEVFALSCAGAPLKTADFLTRAPSPVVAKKEGRAVADPGTGEEPLSTNLDDLRKAIASSSFGKQVLKGEPIGDGRGNNHQALLNCFNELARVTLDFQPEAVLEILEQGSFRHPEHYGTDPAEEFWLMFPGQREHWEQRRAEMAAARAIAARFARRAVKDLKRAPAVASESTPSPQPEKPQEPEEEEPRYFPLTDVGNGERFAHYYGGSVICCGKTWYAWDGRRFSSRLADTTIYSCAKDTVRSMTEEIGDLDPDGIALLKTHALKSESGRAVREMLTGASKEENISVDPNDLDSDKTLLNVMNGTLDLKTGELRPHDKKDRITRLIPLEFLPDARAPLWEAFLSEIMGADSELIVFLQKFVGYSLTGLIREQCFLFLWGDGANGKSTFCQVLLSLLGDYGKSGAPDLLVARYGEVHTTELADLQGARLVVCQETEHGRALAEARTKQLTGGDKIKARFMHQDNFEFVPTHKLVLAGNHKPRIRGTDGAIWRRVRLVPFEVIIPTERQDPGLLDRLLGELPGILAWAVRGCLEWQRSGLGNPARVAAATRAYRISSDVLKEFLDEMCIEDSSAQLLTATLYASYKRWTEGAGERTLSKSMLTDELKRRGYEGRHTYKGGAWLGLRLKTAQDTLKIVEGEKDAKNS